MYLQTNPSPRTVTKPGSMFHGCRSFNVYTARDRSTLVVLRPDEMAGLSETDILNRAAAKSQLAPAAIRWVYAL